MKFRKLLMSAMLRKILTEKMKFQGQIRKMCTENGKPIQYYLNLGGDLLHMNALFNREITFQHIGYQCLNCNSDQKTYRMGFCKRCFFESPYASETIIRPELSRAHTGEEDRDLEVEKTIQLAPHIVYLAYTGEVKVGVTRESQMPTRWIDQGATFALPIARTENRYEAGMIEVALKQHLPDKTNYKKMLEDDFEDEVDLADFRNKIEQHFPDNFQNFYNNTGKMWRLDYPYETPKKITAFTLDRRPLGYTGVLNGIKGQYLSFTDGSVMNVRNHEGFLVELTL